jgi:cell wall-associated NlpC family hydrolase
MISSAPGHSTTTLGVLPAPQAGGGVASVVALAQAQIGKVYKWGASIDSTLQTVGYDCSSLVASVYAHEGFTLPRTSQQQFAATTPTTDPQPGDLVFGSFHSPNDHVGIYAGNGMVTSALDELQGIKTTPLWKGATFGHVAGYAGGGGTGAATTGATAAGAPAGVQSADATAFWKWALSLLLLFVVLTAMHEYGGAWDGAASGLALLVLTSVLLTQGGKAATNTVALFA